MTLSKKLTQDVRELMRQFTKNNKKRTLSKIKKLVLKDNPKPRTQTIRFSHIKKLFRDITKDEEWLREIRPDPKITTAVIQENNTVRDQRKLITVDKKTIDTLMGFADSSNVYDVAMYLLFVSGRRVSELNSAQFINAKGNQNIRIKGVKKRTDNIVCEFSPLIRKSNFFKVLRKYRKMRTLQKGETFHRALNRRIKQAFPDKQYKPHVLRGFYVTYAFKFRNKTDSKINTFIMNTLCHQSINASMNYTQYKLSEDIVSDILR